MTPQCDVLGKEAPTLIPSESIPNLSHYHPGLTRYLIAERADPHPDDGSIHIPDSVPKLLPGATRTPGSHSKPQSAKL